LSGFVGFSFGSVSASRVSPISGSPLMGLSLKPSISLGVFQTKRERKNKKEWSDRKKRRGEEVYGETEKEGKRIIKNIIKKE
jgi:hypothetical protein